MADGIISIVFIAVSALIGLVIFRKPTTIERVGNLASKLKQMKKKLDWTARWENEL